MSSSQKSSLLPMTSTETMVDGSTRGPLESLFFAAQGSTLFRVQVELVQICTENRPLSRHGMPYRAKLFAVVSPVSSRSRSEVVFACGGGRN